MSAPSQELLAPLHVLSPTPCLIRFPPALACVHCFLDHITFPQAGVGLLFFNVMPHLQANTFLRWLHTADLP